MALEASAELAYRRLVEVARSRRGAGGVRRGSAADEARHAEAFRVLTAVLTDDDRLAAGVSAERPGRASSAAISPWFMPAARWRGRPAGPGPGRGRRSFGSGAPVVVRSGRADADKVAVLDECLDRAGLGRARRRARSAAIRVSFMLGYDRADRSNVNDPELVDVLARYLRRHGVDDVAVLEAPTVYGNLFAHRSVAEVAALLRLRLARRTGSSTSATTCGPFVFDRGLRAAGDQRDLARRRPAHRDAEAAHRPDRVRAPEPLDARGQHRRDRRDLLRRRAGSTSARPP